jgi:hypothetical protein
MRNASEPRATRRLGPKCIIIVQKSIQKMLPVSNGFSAGFPPARGLPWSVTDCKQRAGIHCYHRTRINRGWRGFSHVGKYRDLFHKDFHKQFSPRISNNLALSPGFCGGGLQHFPHRLRDSRPHQNFSAFVVGGKYGSCSVQQGQMLSVTWRKLKIRFH